MNGPGTVRSFAVAFFLGACLTAIGCETVAGRLSFDSMGGSSAATGGTNGDSSCEGIVCDNAAPFCRDGSCYACTEDAHCESNDGCDLASGLCRERCSTDQACDESERCGPSGFCVECLESSDCLESSRPICHEDGICVECLGNADCLDPEHPNCTDASECED